MIRNDFSASTSFHDRLLDSCKRNDGTVDERKVQEYYRLNPEENLDRVCQNFVEGRAPAYDR